MPKNTSIKHVLIIGSGPIIIGQACEFDYSGTQASRSLREEGIRVSLINSNPATIMTDPVTADHIYLLPLNVESIIKILEEQIEKGRPIDAVLPTMGGQTALNLCKEADEMQVWTRFNVKLIGVDIKAIDKAEDRELFRRLMIEIGIDVAPSRVANSMLEGKEIAQEIGFPLVIRPSYTLGGSGGGFVHKKEEFEAALDRGLKASPTHEVLVEKAVLGWKEYELELLRDADDNVVIICVVENLDPMGVHTGDSITVAPAMTLSDRAYQEMRNQAIKIMRSIGNFAGGCNVQFALNPEDEKLIAIEINPRVSRSSALASKATGYPIAKIAAKLAIGYRLDELENQITKTTSAYFEPALDYVVVKIPRWNFDKFAGADETLGLQMKSVGEVMSIGRTFIEALQKACQSLENDSTGLGSDGRVWKKSEEILEHLQKPSWDRIFRIKDALSLGVSVRTIHKLTQIDVWFLNQINELVKTELELRKFSLENIPFDFMMELKQKGYSDSQIGFVLNNTEEEVATKRKSMGIRRVYKLVDTCAAEFPAQTPYYYSTFEGSPSPNPFPKGRGISDDDSFKYETADPILYATLKDFATKHRGNPTQAEDILWTLLKGKKIESHKFRRQHIIGKYIADFVCLDKKLVIEVDGAIHQLPENKESDIQRTEWLNSKGYSVLRFTNEEIIGGIENVINKIVDVLDKAAKSDTAEVLPFGKDLGWAGMSNESVVSSKKKIIVLGSGPNRIGQGIEFDYCCVHGLLAIKECGYEAIMVNCNPETVSTDFDMADKLYKSLNGIEASLCKIKG